ncbi:uncharacterized protein LOC144767011 isoform X2 [Lissotriton helveticus]
MRRRCVLQTLDQLCKSKHSLSGTSIITVSHILVYLYHCRLSSFDFGTTVQVLSEGTKTRNLTVIDAYLATLCLSRPNFHPLSSWGNIVHLSFGDVTDIGSN